MRKKLSATETDKIFPDSRDFSEKKILTEMFPSTNNWKKIFCISVWKKCNSLSHGSGSNSSS